MNLLLAVAIGAALTLVVRDVRQHAPTIVRDLGLER